MQCGHHLHTSNVQAILITSVRAVLSLVWELAARVITTTLLFGVFESVKFSGYSQSTHPTNLIRDQLLIIKLSQVSQVLASTTLEGLWNFLTSTTLKQIMIMR